MNEIEKLYENAGVEPVLFYDCESYNQKVEKGYLFTAEKQLELIKWLGELDLIEIMRTVGEEKDWIISSRYDISEGIYHFVSRNKSFDNALAILINNLWQNLTEEEKEQIRGILE